MRIALLAVLVSLPAFATGEKVVVTASAAALKDTLCISMNCVERGGSDVVAARAVRGGLEFTVTDANGRVKLAERVSLTPEGRVSSVDLVRVGSRALKAIEGGVPSPTKVAAKPAAPAQKPKLIARR